MNVARWKPVRVKIMHFVFGDVVSHPVLSRLISGMGVGDVCSIPMALRQFVTGVDSVDYTFEVLMVA